jgi:hypothetical protein
VFLFPLYVIASVAWQSRTVQRAIATLRSQ